MKTYATRKIVKTLRRLNLKPARVGCSSGHSRWIDSKGREIQAVTRKKDMNFESIFSLGRDLESKGICSRREFVEIVKST